MSSQDDDYFKIQLLEVQAKEQQEKIDFLETCLFIFYHYLDASAELYKVMCEQGVSDLFYGWRESNYKRISEKVFAPVIDGKKRGG